MGAAKDGITTKASKAEEKKDSNWAMPYWYKLIFQDLGKTFSSLCNTYNSVATPFADPELSENPQNSLVVGRLGPAIELGSLNIGPVAVTGWNGSQNREPASRWRIFFLGIGRVLQGGALIYNFVASTRNTIVKYEEKAGAKLAVMVLEASELVFFIGSIITPANEGILSIFADCCGSSGTVIRCIDDKEWDMEAISETVGSSAVVIKIVADQIKKRNVEPMAKTCTVVAAIACAVIDPSSRGYGLYKCVSKCVSKCVEQKSEN
ncbi:hypothetical protein H2198_008290 [Neophaeococcomyces mojaviensis]|uniref:Uncharacterized protein n=1 Tax=Neophaeococcomyces mojaviensis TaxID=3383035 RepID=A0ACC2ZXU5_9EURO|nr:hypothetical protein H2198_008290 [Knufia sp. JES_112]